MPKLVLCSICGKETLISDSEMGSVVCLECIESPESDILYLDESLVGRNPDGSIRQQNQPVGRNNPCST